MEVGEQSKAKGFVGCFRHAQHRIRGTERKAPTEYRTHSLTEPTLQPSPELFFLVRSKHARQLPHDAREKAASRNCGGISLRYAGSSRRIAGRANLVASRCAVGGAGRTAEAGTGGGSGTDGGHADRVDRAPT